MDCGSTCLRMIASYHGRRYRQETLRELTNVDNEGVSMMGISDAAEAIGFHTLGVKVSYQKILEDLPLPCIAHWRQNHFVVVYRINKTHVWIADPAAGKFKLTRQEFLDGWASDMYEGEQVGLILLLETTPAFYENEGEQQNRGNLSYLLNYLFKYKSYLFQLVLGILLGSVLQLAFPFLMKALVDVGITTQDFDFIVMILVAQLVLFFSQISVEYIRSWLLLHIGIRVNISLVSDFLIKMMKLPIKFFDTRHTGDILQRIYDNQRVEDFLGSASLITLFSLINFIIFGGVLAYFDMTIFWIFVIATIAYLAWVILFFEKRKEYDYRRFDQLAENQSALIQLVSGIQEIKLHNAEKEKRWRWERIQAKLFRLSLKSLQLEQMQRFGASLINESKNIVITFYAAKAVIDGTMTLGGMLAVQYILGQLNAPIEQLINFFRNAQDAKISLERMNEIHMRENEEEPGEHINFLPEDGDLQVENVSFQYGGTHSPEILKDINVIFPKGKTTAIVGTSGSGKTTLVKLLLNFYQPTKGAVRLGDVNLANVQNKLWRNKCGVVMQEGFIFSDTIAKNIALGDERIDKKRMLEAVKIANIQTYIEALPLSYNTKIGEDGIGLSQGQKQRLLIARAVYKNPDYLFFDEATNALDAYNELIIMENLESFFKNRTAIIVAHRLSTVKNADNIIVLESGEMVEQGTHEELAANKGAYYYLVRNQLELGA